MHRIRCITDSYFDLDCDTLRNTCIHVEKMSDAMFKSVLMSGALMVAATVAQADFAKVHNLDEFTSIVSGKTLTRPLVRLEVTPTGDIRGIGVRWEVTGNWSWQDGYFCRDLFWGGDALGYNCQEVQVKENRIRFTSDKGRGDSAIFRLRTE